MSTIAELKPRIPDDPEVQEEPGLLDDVLKLHPAQNDEVEDSYDVVNEVAEFDKDPHYF